MTQSRRIALNIFATYGRSLFAIGVGLFSGRWVLMALGEVDYGLVGLIGGLVGFVSFLNSILASAIGRFYAVSVGAEHKSGDLSDGVEECRKWFCTALLIHSTIPVILVLAGYPLGVWAIDQFLTIPYSKIAQCIWVWRFTCFSCLIAMVTVPFQAMYTAKQEIAELTIYSFITTFLNGLFTCHMASNPGVWLVKYSAWMCFLAAAPQLIIAIRACFKYRECRYRNIYLWDSGRLKSIFKYAISRFIAVFSGMVSSQGQSILVNKFMGPECNASMTIANTVSGHAMSLTGALSGAFWPAIANKAGEEDYAGMLRFGYMTCRLGTLLVLMFAIPICLEIDTLLELWLVKVPPFSGAVCIFLLVREVVQRTTEGHWMVVFALGRGIMRYSLCVSLAGFSLVIASLVMFILGMKMWSICFGFIVYTVLIVMARLYCGWRMAGLSLRTWFSQVFAPVAVTALITMLGGLMPTVFMNACVFRLLITTLICETTFCCAVWICVLTREEKLFVVEKILRRIPGIKICVPSISDN